MRPSSQCSATPLNREPPAGWPASGAMPAVELALGLVERLSRHVDRGGEPVRQRKSRQQRERPPRRAEPLFAPARRTTGGSGAASCRARAPPRACAPRSASAWSPVAVEHESERRPRLAVLRVEPAGLARVMVSASASAAASGVAIGARHLELHDAGVGQADVRRRLLGHLRQHALEDVARADDLIALERFERRPPFDPRAMRREQRVERGVGFAARPCA